MKYSFKVIGLCGRSGSGKGYISDIFSDFGIPSVDTDRVYRDIISEKDSECLRELVCNFGNEILDDSGFLDRKALGKIVFSDPEKLCDLNMITHKYIRERTLDEIKKTKKAGAHGVLIDAPVLFESGFDKLCDILLCVTCPDEKSVERIVSRDGIDENAAKKRLSSQKSTEELRSLCDAEIVNDDIEDPRSQVEKFIRDYSLR